MPRIQVVLDVDDRRPARAGGDRNVIDAVRNPSSIGSAPPKRTPRRSSACLGAPA
jgi:hypothetical protein